MPNLPNPPIPPRPQYSPSMLVIRVQEALRRDGIDTAVDARNAGTAIHAAADLLRALHVVPATAPLHPRVQN